MAVYNAIAHVHQKIQNKRCVITKTPDEAVPFVTMLTCKTLNKSMHSKLNHCSLTCCACPMAAIILQFATTECEKRHTVD